MKENSPVSVVVLDAGPLIHLDELERISLLSEYGEILIPSDVWAEVVQHRPKLALASLPGAVLLTDVPALPPRLAALILEKDLGREEQAALAWLSLFGGGLMLSDDQDARRAASILGFQVTGTVGILIRAQRQGRLGRDELIGLVGTLRTRTSLHVSNDFITAVLASIPQ